jgi:type IV pilus assembly protein PilQ
MSRALPRITALAAVLALAGAALPLGALADTAPASATVESVTVVEEAGAVEVGIEVTGPVVWHTSVLSAPVRYVIDVPDASNGVAWGAKDISVGPLRAVRVEQLADTPPATRIVLELSQPTPWTLRRAGTGIVVARFVVPQAHGPARSPWSGGTAAASGSQPDPGIAGPEHPFGAAPDLSAGPAAANPSPGPAAPNALAAVSQADSTAAPDKGVRAGPPAGVPGMVVAQAAPGTAARTLTLDLRDAQLGDIVDALARLCALNVVTDSAISGSRVTIHLVGVTCDEALRFVLDANGLGYRRVGETLIIQPIARLTPPPPGPVLRVYRLEYLQPPIDPEVLVGASSASGGSATISGGAGTVKKDTASFLALFTGTGAQVNYDDRTNSLVVNGTPAQQEAVVALLRQLDVPVPQVLVQALVVDLTTDALKTLGVTWSIFNGEQFTEAAPGAGQFGIGQITRAALTATLTASIQNSKARVLSDPRIAAFDGQEALIFAGDQIPIVNTTTAGNPPVTSQTVTFQPIGVTLKIIPKINADRTINVLVHPLVTTASSYTPATANNPNGLPIIATREAATTARVADGDSVVLGGLMRYSDIKSIQKIPYLGDLPFIGSLFRLATTNHEESEVVIVLTPRIVSTGQLVQPPQPVQP